jgi:hypothetical protein
MTEWKLYADDCNCLRVAGLKSEWWGLDPMDVGLAPDVMLIITYPEGDCDRITPQTNRGKLLEALYDLYQTCEELKEGDTFTYDGRLIAQCRGVHVIGLHPGDLG